MHTFLGNRIIPGPHCITSCYQYPIGVAVMSSNLIYINEDNIDQPLFCVQHQAILEREFVVDISFEDISTTSDDFSNTDMEFIFNSISDNPQCFQFMINTDNVLENNEEFMVVLSTTDENIDIDNRNTRVTILDSSQVVLGFTNTFITVNEGDNFSTCVAIFSGELSQNVQLPLFVVPMNQQGMLIVCTSHISTVFCLLNFGP